MQMCQKRFQECRRVKGLHVDKIGTVEIMTKLSTGYMGGDTDERDFSGLFMWERHWSLTWDYRKVLYACCMETCKCCII